MSERDRDLSVYGGSASSVKFCEKGGTVKLRVAGLQIVSCLGQYITPHV